jgi:hypothetical protein
MDVDPMDGVAPAPWLAPAPQIAPRLSGAGEDWQPPPMMPPGFTPPARPLSPAPPPGMGEPGAGAPPPKGPFGMIENGNPWDWTYHVREGATPTPVEHDLAERIAALSDKIEPFRDCPGAMALLDDLKRLFGAVLVQGGIAPDRYLPMVDAHETRFLTTIVTPAHRANLRKPVLVSVLALVLILLVAEVPAVSLQAWMGNTLSFPLDVSNLRPFALVIAGTLLGRLLYYATSWGETVVDVATYDLAQAQSRSVAVSLLFDVIVGTAACAVFLSGLIVITIAEGTGGTGGFGTGQIATNGMVAFVVGILVGLAKTEFLARLRKVAVGKAQ